MNIEKITLERQGFPDKVVTRAEMQYINYLKHGWKIKQTDKLKMVDAGASQSMKSSDFAANPAGVKKLREALAGKPEAEIKEIFSGEARPKMVELLDSLMVKKSNQQDEEKSEGEDKPVLSINFSDDEEGKEALKKALEGVEDKAAAFSGEQRESMLALYAELTK